MTVSWETICPATRTPMLVPAADPGGPVEPICTAFFLMEMILGLWGVAQTANGRIQPARCFWVSPLKLSNLIYHHTASYGGFHFKFSWCADYLSTCCDQVWFAQDIKELGLYQR